MNEFSSAIGAALSMIVTLEADLVEIVLLSLQVSLSAVAIASVIALPLGALIALQPSSSGCWSTCCCPAPARWDPWVCCSHRPR
jgi:ABC-type tungstate transport system substrate-binding protein